MTKLTGWVIISHAQRKMEGDSSSFLDPMEQAPHAT